MWNSVNDSCLEIELESAETLCDVESVCEKVRKSECTLAEKEQQLEDELKRLRTEKLNLSFVRKKAETKRIAIKG